MTSQRISAPTKDLDIECRGPMDENWYTAGAGKMCIGYSTSRVKSELPRGMGKPLVRVNRRRSKDERKISVDSEDEFNRCQRQSSEQSHIIYVL